jgi:hypothetical protein
MDDTSFEDCITIKQQYGHVSNEESLKIANSIDEELLPFFIKEVVQETESNVIPIERKGLNLFHPYLSNIEGMRNVISVKPLNYHGPYSLRYKFFSFFNLDKSNILLTDAVTTGSEIRKILRGSAFKLKALGGFKKVCGYLALKSALNELEREFPDISFKFLKIVETIEEYYEEHKKIIYVYQKRMEPIDEEHQFIVVEVKPTINLGDIRTKINEIIKNKYGENFELRENELGIDSKYNFTFYFNDPVEVLETVLKVHLQKGDQIEKLVIRFKFSSLDSKLRMMALSMPNLNKETRLQCIERIISSSCNRKVPRRYCNVHFIFRLLAKNNRCLLCAECIDSNVSALLLTDIYSSISKSGLMKVS